MNNSAHSQSVGLVLSGGGAKGIAHIGVIKALEENNIPIDYIVGTSIGAIIGSMYACGYTTEEMTEMMQTDEFYNWSKGEIPEQFFYYYKKNNEHADMFSLKFRKRHSSLSLAIPTNLIANQPMDMGVLEIYSQHAASANYNFDSLLIPFRCIATDIYKNKGVSLNSGDLGMAVRASMTFPFYFKPISIDGILYFDGGIANNFPYDVMYEEFKPDYIIGSLVTSETQRPDEDDIILQIENMITTEQHPFKIPDSIGITIFNYTKVALLT